MVSPRTRRDFLKAGIATGVMLSGCTSTPDTGSEPTSTSGAGSPTEEFPPPEPESETPAGSASMPVGSDWPQYQFDVANTGYSSDGPAVPDEPDVFWQFYTRATPPVVDDGTLYSVEFATERTLVARDAASGRQRWTAEIDGGAATTPAVAGDRLIVLTYSTLFGFDAGSGTELWSVDVGRGTPGAPIIDGDRTYIANGSFEDWPAAAFAFSLDGDRHWSVELDGDVRGSPALVDDALVVAGSSGVHAFEGEDGRERWSRETADGYETTVAADGRTAYLADETGRVRALRTDDGSTRWQTDAATPLRASGAAIGDGTVFVPTEAGLFALEKDDGTESWFVDTSDPLTTPATDGEVVYVGANGFDSPTLHAIDAANGEERWHYTTEEKAISDYVEAGVFGPPTLVHGGLYVLAADGLYAFGRED